MAVTLNFRISLDLFQLATIGTNHGHQTAKKASQAARKWLCGVLARRLEMIYTLLFFSENLTAQKSNGLRSGDFGGHCAVKKSVEPLFLG